MRDIRFKQLVHGQWHYWGFCIKDNHKYFVGPADLEARSYQFTGKFDIDNKPVFEGDIIHSPNHIPGKMVIEFIDGGFCATWPKMLFPLDICHFYPNSGTQIKVIGTMEENKDLVKWL